MKKAAITTAISISNYGTKLQAWAMCEILKERNFDATILEYSCSKDLSFITLFKRYIGNIIHTLSKGADYKLVDKFNYEYKSGTLDFRQSIIKRYKAIDANDKDIPHYRYIGSKESLKKYAYQYDVLVTGSDQVWHPVLNKNNLWFLTLNFASPSARRVAYAPSLGVDALNKDQQEEFKVLLKDMGFISLREDSGVKAIQPLTDKEVSLVLDPTLLIGRKLWDTVLDEEKAFRYGDYCLCYLLGTSPEHREICEHLAKEKGLKLLNFAHFKKYNEVDEKLSGEKLYDVTPAEFIGLIKNAKFVITDSFHCSAFSMQYHTPFMSLLRFQQKDSMSTNTRLYSMLEQFGLGNRIYVPGTNTIEEISNASIDYSKVDSLLAEKQQQSSRYLDNALKGV